MGHEPGYLHSKYPDHYDENDVPYPDFGSWSSLTYPRSVQKPEPEDRSTRCWRPDPNAARDWAKEIPKFSIWKHAKSNFDYVVMGIANLSSTKATYPVTVVYQDSAGRLWTRPAADWHRSMTLVWAQRT